MLLVCPLSRIDAALKLQPSHMLSLISPDAEAPVISAIAPSHRLVLRFNDIAASRPGLTAPDRNAIEALIAFGRNWENHAPLLIHCWAGISRSTAAAYIIACALGSPGRERQQSARLRTASPAATPNPLMVAIADKILGRDGAMLRAIEEIGRGAEASEGNMFRMEID